MARFSWQAVRRPDWKTLKRPVMLTLGYTFLALGVLGLFLPILQGFLFLAIGLAILARQAAWARLLRMRLVRRYPKLGAKMNDAERTAHRWLRRAGEKWRGFTTDLRLRWRLWGWQLRESWRGSVGCAVRCQLRRATDLFRRGGSSGAEGRRPVREPRGGIGV